ncbi:unnamed protein product [Fructobacillus tropaeoli]|uniref:hypothetical protein n=1 Tax=Fructobacillus tropaeoli TaxID=709323 RepID=UPI002D905697|nr:unnamed protein product [Fructobacillus tropaeoli]
MTESIVQDSHLLINGESFLTQRCGNKFLTEQQLGAEKITINPNVELTQSLQESLSLGTLRKEEISFLISSLRTMNLDVRVISKTWVIEKDVRPRTKDLALIEWVPGQYLSNEVLLHWLDDSPLHIELTPNIAAALPIESKDIDLLQKLLPGLFDHSQFIYVKHVE